MGSKSVEFSKLIRKFNPFIQASTIQISSSSVDYVVPYSVKADTHLIDEKSDTRLYAKASGKDLPPNNKGLKVPYFAPLKALYISMADAQPRGGANLTIKLLNTDGKLQWTTGEFTSLNRRLKDFIILPRRQNDASQLPQK